VAETASGVGSERKAGRDLRFKKTGRDTVVAVKLDIVEGCSDAIPAGHNGGLCSAYMSHRCNDDVAEAQGPAYKHNFKLDRGSYRQLPGAEKKDSGGADVASNKGYGSFFGNSASSAKAQREVQSGTGVFPMFRMYAHGMRWHPDETPRLRRTQKRSQAKGRNTRYIRERLRANRSFAGLGGWFAWP
jgi:hypothetical protein